MQRFLSNYDSITPIAVAAATAVVTMATAWRHHLRLDALKLRGMMIGMAGKHTVKDCVEPEARSADGVGTCCDVWSVCVGVVRYGDQRVGVEMDALASGECVDELTYIHILVRLIVSVGNYDSDDDDDYKK